MSAAKPVPSGIGFSRSVEPTKTPAFAQRARTSRRPPPDQEGFPIEIANDIEY